MSNSPEGPRDLPGGEDEAASNLLDDIIVERLDEGWYWTDMTGDSCEGPFQSEAEAWEDAQTWAYNQVEGDSDV